LLPSGRPRRYRSYPRPPGLASRAGATSPASGRGEALALPLLPSPAGLASRAGATSPASGRGLAGGLDSGGPAATGQPGCDDDRDDRDQDHERHHDVHLRQPLAEADGSEDPQRERVLSAGGEVRDYHLIE